MKLHWILQIKCINVNTTEQLLMKLMTNPQVKAKAGSSWLSRTISMSNKKWWKLQCEQSSLRNSSHLPKGNSSKSNQSTPNSNISKACRRLIPSTLPIKAKSCLQTPAKRSMKMHSRLTCLASPTQRLTMRCLATGNLNLKKSMSLHKVV